MRCLGRGSHQAAVGSQGRICATLPCRGMRASVSCTMVCSQGWPRGGGRGVLFTTACQASSSSAAGVELAQRAPHSERNRWLCCLISALTGAGTGARARSGTERETRPVPPLGLAHFLPGILRPELAGRVGGQAGPTAEQEKEGNRLSYLTHFADRKQAQRLADCESCRERRGPTPHVLWRVQCPCRGCVRLLCSPNLTPRLRNEGVGAVEEKLGR